MTADQAMTVVGAGLAMSVATFAVVAVRQNDGVPWVNGQEHLALFSKPSRSQDDRVVASGNGGSGANGHETSLARIDYAPTASIKARPATPGRVTRVTRDRVLIDGSNGQLELRLGDAAPGLGRLENIRLIDGRWTAIFGGTVNRSQSSR